MTVVDAATAQARLDKLLAAYDDAMGAYSEGIGDRQIVHQKLENLRAEITYWQSVQQALTAETAGATLNVATAKWAS
jgi:hypothetical protein